MARLALALLVLAGCGASSQPSETNRATSSAAVPAAAPPEGATPPAGDTPSGSAAASALPTEAPSVAALPTTRPRHPVYVVASGVRACAVFDNGMLQCWGGLNRQGELGLGHANTVKVPGWVEGIRDVRKVVLAGARTCAVVGSGELFCWGRNIQFDPRATLPVVRPARVTGLSAVVDVALGHDHACALDNAGEVHCWGSNSVGQLGLGPLAIQIAPREPGKVAGLTDVAGILASGDFNVAWTRNGELYLWGRSRGGKPMGEWTPRKVGNVSGVRRAWLFGGHTCALISGGKVRCFVGQTLAAFEAGKEHDFGAEFFARRKLFGIKSPSKRWPMVFPDGRGLSRVVDVALFELDASARTESGEVFSWGKAEWGTVGRPVNTDGFYPPTRIAGISDAVAIAGSWWHRCVLHRSGAVSCFGKGGRGRLGTASASNIVTPVRVKGIPKATALASNEYCTFVIGEDHGLWVWGESELNACGFDYDALDDEGDYTPTLVPVKVPLAPMPP